jgi:hypothetical protein
VGPAFEVGDGVDLVRCDTADEQLIDGGGYSLDDLHAVVSYGLGGVGLLMPISGGLFERKDRCGRGPADQRVRCRWEIRGAFAFDIVSLHIDGASRVLASGNKTL